MKSAPAPFSIQEPRGEDPVYIRDLERKSPMDPVSIQRPEGELT